MTDVADPPDMERFAFSSDPPGADGNATAWAKAWEEHNTRLFDLLKGIERDAVEPVSKLLERLQECRQSLGDPPDARLRRVWRNLLAELWEAARAALYGDLGPARQHAGAARRLERELRQMLEISCGG
ncbi:MAG TPA: hypothetical protein VGX68_04540 [Thermoanaerobaculia bacterium]|jgi:hypothetical protein|nr:hypothetical protein [Thermoanaerobaculia bacterium]